MSDILEQLKKTPSVVIDKIKSTLDVTHEVDFPGHPGVKVLLRILTAAETRRAKIENQTEFTSDKISVEVHNVRDYEMQEAIHVTFGITKCRKQFMDCGA